MLCSQKIVDSIGLISTGNKQFVDVRFGSSCISDNWKETSICDGLRPGNQVEFMATIKVSTVFISYSACE
jgi:hypothetical protein